MSALCGFVIGYTLTLAAMAIAECRSTYWSRGDRRILSGLLATAATAALVWWLA